MAGYKNSKAYESDSSGGTIDVPDSLRFADTIVRDDYFVINPSKLKTNVYVTVAGQLQRYNGEFFEDTSVVIKGDDGDNAPQMKIQYSSTGVDGWTETLNKAIHKYWRWSTDGGNTWSSDGVKYSADGTGLTPQQEIDLENNTTDRHTHSNKDILDATTGTFTAARQDKLDNFEANWKGRFSTSADLIVEYPTPLAGWGAIVSETGTVWAVENNSWIDTQGSSFGDMNMVDYDPQGIASDVFDRANHTGKQSIDTITDLQTELDKIAGNKTAIEDLDDQLNNETTGLGKTVADINNTIEEDGTGLKARISDLEQGGLSITKIRLHSSSGVYEDGELVKKDNVIYSANGDIDGSNTPIPFATGITTNTWTPLDGKDYKTISYYQQDSNSSTNFITPATDGLLLVSKARASDRLMGIAIDSARGRVSLEHSGIAEKAALENDDFLTKEDADSLYSGDASKKHRVDVSLPSYPIQGVAREVEIESGLSLRGVWTANGVFDLYLRNSATQGAKGISFVSNWTILNSDGSYSTSGAKSYGQTVQSNSNLPVELYRGFNKDEFTMVTIYLHGDNVNNEIKRVYQVRILGTATTINIKGYYEDIV